MWPPALASVQWPTQCALQSMKSACRKAMLFVQARWPGLHDEGKPVDHAIDHFVCAVFCLCDSGDSIQFLQAAAFDLVGRTVLICGRGDSATAHQFSHWRHGAHRLNHHDWRHRHPGRGADFLHQRISAERIGAKRSYSGSRTSSCAPDTHDPGNHHFRAHPAGHQLGRRRRYAAAHGHYRYWWLIFLVVRDPVTAVKFVLFI